MFNALTQTRCTVQGPGQRAELAKFAFIYTLRLSNRHIKHLHTCHACANDNQSRTAGSSRFCVLSESGQQPQVNLGGGQPRSWPQSRSEVSFKHLSPFCMQRARFLRAGWVLAPTRFAKLECPPATCRHKGVTGENANEYYAGRAGVAGMHTCLLHRPGRGAP